MKKPIKSLAVLGVLLMVCCLAFTVSAIAPDTPPEPDYPEGACNISISGKLIYTYDVWYQGSLLSREYSPSSYHVTNYYKNGHPHTGDLTTISNIDMGNVVYTETSGYYTYITYRGTATYSAILL